MSERVKGSEQPYWLGASQDIVTVLGPEAPGPLVEISEQEACRQLVAFPEVLGALEHMHNVFGPINDSVGGKGALMQARAAIKRYQRGG